MSTIVAPPKNPKAASSEREAIDAELEDDAVNSAVKVALHLAQRAGWPEVVEPLFTARVLAQRRHFKPETGAVR